jgi:hypothetical protein
MAPGEIAFNEIDNTLYYGAGNAISTGLATNIIPIGGVKPGPPNDGQMYGMVSGNWARAVNIAGDSMSGGLTVGAGLTVNGATNSKGGLTVTGATSLGGNLTISGGITGLLNATGALIVGGPATFNDVTVAGGAYAEIKGYLIVHGDLSVGTPNAYKVGGGPWLASSDRRIKNVHRKYAGGLAQIEQLQPIVYSYKGNDAAPGGASPAASGKEFIGLVAQECEELFPEMVVKSPGFVDGAAVPDLRGLDTGPLLYAMLNAIKELALRLRAAEAKLERTA